jgi:hypothetical protein
MHPTRNSGFDEDMQKQIKKFRAFDEARELIISYDCSGSHAPFSELLRELLEDEMTAIQLNESLYKLPGLYSKVDAEKLAKIIVTLFGSIVNEGKYGDEGNTKVLFILPKGSEFIVEEVLNEEPSNKILKS